MTRPYRLAAIAVLAICGVAAPPAIAEQSSYGIITSQLLPPQARAAADLGVGWVMLDFTWNTMEASCTAATRPECRAWSVWHDQVTRARGNHLEVLAELGGTPDWANGGKGPAWIPTDIHTWYDFVFAVVTEFKGDVKYWKFWNEPDLTQFLQPGGQTFWSSYDTIARTAFAAIKDADPSAMVVGPDLSSNALSQRSELFRDLVNSYGWMFDVISIHYYRERDGVTLGQRLDQLEASVAVGKPVWITEVGEDSEKVGLRAQEAFYREALYQYSEHRGWVSNIFFYHLFGDPGYNLTSAPDLEQRKPAFAVYREWVASGSTAGFLPRVIESRQLTSKPGATVSLGLAATRHAAGPGVIVEGAYNITSRIRIGVEMQHRPTRVLGFVGIATPNNARRVSVALLAGAGFATGHASGGAVTIGGDVAVKVRSRLAIVPFVRIDLAPTTDGGTDRVGVRPGVFRAGTMLRASL